MIAVSTHAAAITRRYMLGLAGWKPSSRSMAGRRVDGSPAWRSLGAGRFEAVGEEVCDLSGQARITALGLGADRVKMMRRFSLMAD